MPPLRQIRAERLLTVRQLAALAEVAPSTVHLIERGKRVPHPGTMARIAAALDTAPASIDEFAAAIAARGRPASSDEQEKQEP